MKTMTTRDLCFISIFAAVIAVLAQVSIPMPSGVPLTLQTFAISLAGIILGAKRGTIATIIYVLLGVIGAPVFANLTGGLNILLGPTGGFIFSFPILAFAAGMWANKEGKIWLPLGLIIGVTLNYICGIIMFSIVMSSSLAIAFTVCVLPYIPTDIVKIVLSAVLGLRIKRLLKSAGLLT